MSAVAAPRRRRRRGHASGPATPRAGGILLASEGRAFTPAAIDEAARLAEDGAAVYVFSIARIWGTSLGLPMPGLLPTTREWDEQHAIVQTAVRALRKRSIPAEGRVVGTRKGAKRIVAEAERLGCSAIVMGADRPRSWLLADLMWSQEPQRVRRRARRPVHLVEA